MSLAHLKHAALQVSVLCCARLVTAATNWPKDPSRDAGNWACLKLHLRVEAKYWRVAIGLGHENPYHRNIRLLISITIYML